MWNDIRKTHLAPRALLIDKGGWELYVLCTRGGERKEVCESLSVCLCSAGGVSERRGGEGVKVDE